MSENLPPMTWVPKPLSVGDGVIGAEIEESPEDAAEAQRQRTARATPEMIAAAEQIAAESKASIQKAFGGKSMHELWLEGQRAESTGDGPRGRS